LRPTEWARAAGVPAGEILAFLTGKTRSISDATLQKLAAAAKVTPDALLK
jgi:transcriptional regulator with XRE-family HTH domain